MTFARMVRPLVAAVGAAAMCCVVAAPVSAGAAFVPTVNGVAQCRADGQYEITWTLVNGLEEGTLVQDAFFVGNVEEKIVFSPNPTPPGIGSESHATSVLPGSTSRSVEIAVQITPANDPVPITIGTVVQVAGDCVASATTVASTTAAPRQVSASASPRFTG